MNTRCRLLTTLPKNEEVLPKDLGQKSQKDIPRGILLYSVAILYCVDLTHNSTETKKLYTDAGIAIKQGYRIYPDLTEESNFTNLSDHCHFLYLVNVPQFKLIKKPREIQKPNKTYVNSVEGCRVQELVVRKKLLN